MPDYLADRFANWMGWGSPDGTNLLGGRPGEVVTPRTGSAARVSQGRTAEDTTGLRRRHPSLEDDAGAGQGWSAYSGEPLPYRKLPPAPGGPMPPLEPTQRVAPHPMPPDVPMGMPAGAMGIHGGIRGGAGEWNRPGGGPPMAAPGIPAPRRLPGAGQPMPQAGGGGQPQPALMRGVGTGEGALLGGGQGVSGPAGTRPDMLGRDGATDLLGRAKKWLGGEAFPANQPMSRGMVLAQMLGQFGAGLSRTGRVGTGLEMANKGMWQAREGEQERQYRQLEMDYKRRQLERGEAPKVFGDKATGYYTMGPDGQPRQVVQPGEAAVKSPTSIEAALLHPDPEIRARAEELRDKAAAIKGTPTPFQQEEHALKLAKLKADIAKANRPAGTGTTAAPSTLGKLYREMEALPPDDPKRETYRRMIQTETLRGRSGVDAADREPGYLPPPTGAQTKAAEAVSVIDDLNARVAGIEAMGDDLPDLMTSPAQGMASLTAVAKRWGVPVSTAQTQYLEKQRTLQTQIEDLTSTIRLARSGQSLTAGETASAERYLPTSGDDVTTLRTKLKGLKEIAAKARRRNVDILDPKKGIRAEPEAAAAPPPPRTEPPPATTGAVAGAEVPIGGTWTDPETGKKYRRKGQDAASQDSWEELP